MKQKAISGMIWNAVERFGGVFLLFVSNLVLARLLSPEDFGCVGMLLVFISVSDAIVDGGFGAALIQKEKPTQTDYSTIFYWNIILSFFLYISLYLIAPSISAFYKIPLLCNILRVQSIVLVMNAFSIVQRNLLKKQIAFKKNALINLIAIIISTSAAILAAYYGFGVWSLVIKSLSAAALLCALYWNCCSWRPVKIFSFKAFKNLFRFGGFMFLDTIINTLYCNLISLILGKKFSASILGYYTQALKLSDVPRNCLSSIVSNVSFPVMSSIQSDSERFLRASKAGLKSIMFINIPLMLLMIVIAKPIFTLLFTDKWSQSVPFFQALCIMGLIFTAYEFNQNILMSKGKSNALFFIRVAQCIFGVSLIFLGLKWGIWGVITGYVFSAYIIYIIITFFTKRFIGYGLLSQLKDIAPTFIASLIAALTAFLLSEIHKLHNLYLICLQIAVFGVVYIFLCKLFNIKELYIYINGIFKRK